MTDTNLDYDPEDFEGNVEPKMATLPRSEVRRLEKDRKELAAARAELESARRQLAFSRAGIDPDDPAAKYFVKAYDGDLDPEAIRAEAVAARLIGTPPASSAEVAAHEGLARAASGASTPSEEDEINRQLADAAKRHWRDADQAIPEIMRIVEANDIKLRVTG
jgi:hypothetical protein